MSKIGYYLSKIKYVLRGRNPEIINEYFRKQGVVIGERTHIFSDISMGEPYLINIGNDVTISNNVSLITHDSSISKVIKNTTDIFGKICIEDNCFIGMNSIVLPGVHVSRDVIVAAGAVVTKSINEPGTIWGGNPARKIGTTAQFAEKYAEYAVDLHSIESGRVEYIKNCPKIEK